MKNYYSRKPLIFVVSFLLIVAFVQPSYAIEVNIIPAVNIGLLTPQTGALSVYSPPWENAANLAITDLNTEQNSYNFVLQVADTQTDVTATQTAAQSLAGLGVVGIAGPASSSDLASLESFSAANTIPIISYSATSPQIQRLNDNGYIIDVTPPEDTRANATAKLLDLLEYKEVVVLYDDSAPFTTDLKDNLEQEFSGVSSSIYYTAVSDIATMVSSFSSTADALYIASVGNQATLEAIFAELVAKNVNVTVYGASIVQNAYDASPANVQSYLDGLFNVDYGVKYDKKFIDSFTSAYASDPSTEIYTGEVYDAIKLIGESYVAVAQGGASLRDAILATSRPMASGYIDFDQYGSLAQVRFGISQVQQTIWSLTGWWNYDSFKLFENFQFPVVRETSTVTETVTDTLTSTTIEASTSTSEEISTVFTTVTNQKSEVSLAGTSFFFSTILIILIGVQRRNLVRRRKL